MNIKAIIKQIDNCIKTREITISRLDDELDVCYDYGISQAVLDAICEAHERKIRDQYLKIGELERFKALINCKAIKPNEWLSGFLKSFDVGTRIITLSQLNIFKKANKGEPFIVNDRKYTFDYHFKGKAGMLIVESIDFGRIDILLSRSGGDK